MSSAFERHRVAWRAVGVPILLLAAACTSYVDTARVAYGDGRYLEVAEDLARREAEVSRLRAQGQAQYGMYRGLALLMLGDYAGADRWLAFSAETARLFPEALGPQQREQLAQGRALLDGLLKPAPAVVRASPQAQPASESQAGKPRRPVLVPHDKAKEP
ncbi:MAG: hypothetical protein HY744_31515 [Deltaproteobacteria bacterium]|nr:hypothetical protein [Deltaproteobacteria bacterium]